MWFGVWTWEKVYFGGGEDVPEHRIYEFGERTKGSIAVSPYQKTIPPEKLEKPGLLKRFLNWIAKGADKSNMGKASCPT